MTPERWQKIEDLFQSARNRTSVAERAAFLDGACANDAELRAEVEGLLVAEDSAGSFINTSAMKIAAGMIADERAAEMLGQRVAHYKILSPLGAGGMGEIYLAEDAELGRKVALKFLPDYTLVDDERVRRFRQEARVASALSHPNIAHIYEIGESEGASFIALEFVEGQTLAARIAGRPLGVEEIVDIATQVADALDEAHAHGITHRDIKAANIMLTPRGRVKVLNFGLAKMTQAGTVAEAPGGQAAQVETRTGVVMGTVSYMSPEQAMGREVDTRTDIWSLGVVLYEMATGRLPFNGDSVTETIDRIAHAQPEAVARFNYDVPPELEAIIKKALRKKREERYQSAPLQTMKIVRLTVSGNAGSVNISPDGKYVAYRLRTDDGLQSLWVKQLATGTTLQIVPPGTVAYEGTTFSRDSNVIYYVAAGALYQVPVIGGAPQRLLTKTSRPATQSPEGSRVAFFRADDRSADLTVAKAGGTRAYVLSA